MQKRAFRPCDGFLGAARLSEGRRAFTLLEILLVLSLLALLGSVMVGGAVSMLKTNETKDPETSLLKMLQTVRAEAVSTDSIIDVKALPEDKGFSWGAAGLEALPPTPGVKVHLIGAVSGRASLIAGQIEEEPIKHLHFYPDGSCDPVRVEVKRGEVRRVYAIDPWTAAPMPEGDERK
jgi:prepilin-type N-terminal cleavage/methylation domain-containing protein